MSLPVDELGLEWREALNEFEKSVLQQARLEASLERGKSDVGKRREMVYGLTMKLIAREKRITLGPDGGK